MKSIQIADQPRLSLARTVRITIDGIRYRLFRASVTVAVIAVAVAFLMNILSESLVKRSVAADTRDRIARWRLVHEWMARLSTPGTMESIIVELAGANESEPAYIETASMARLMPDRMEVLHHRAVLAATFFTFFNDLDYAKRRNLIHTAEGTKVFRRLSTEAGRKQFDEALSNIKSVRFPASAEELDTFLAEWPDLRSQLDQVRRGRVAAIREIDAARGKRAIIEALADAEGEFGAAIREAGFAFDAQEVAPEVARQARRLLDVRFIEKSMEQRLTRQVIAQKFNILPADVNVMLLWKMLLDHKGAALYLQKMKESELDATGFDADRLVWLAQTRQEEKLLVRAGRRTSDTGKGWMGLGERLSWLLFVSMLVCGIGISNAMLMTVTERFTEIATLKCLGALDGFIMIVFVLESCFLGVVGGTIGAILGSVIGVGRMLAAFGIWFVPSVPVIDLFVGMLLAVVMGVLLAALAAVYPAFKAARLHPMEAMRIE